MTGAVTAAAVKMAAALRQQRREVQLAKPKAQLVAGVHAIVTDPTFYSAGANPTTAVHILDRSLDLLRPLFDHVMNTAADDAADDYDYVDPAKTPDYSNDVQDRAEYQAQHIQKLHDDIQQAKKDNQSLDQFLGRIASYGDALVGAYNAGYAGAVLASAPDAKIIWELGATEHCAACLDRAGKEFTFKSLPGYPGDGAFGGDICEGGPRCGCSLNFVRGGASASLGTNTQRDDAIQWYDQQLTNAEQRRADNAQARSDFVSSLPEGPQSRAVARDTVRQDAARDANAASSYQGVSTEPRDISAATVAAGVGKNFNPSEPRDGHGRWTGEGGKQESSGSGSHGSGGAGAGMVSVGGGESVKVITDAELNAREGTTNSRAVSMQEFQQVAAQGKSIMDGFRANASPPTGLTDNLDAIKASTLGEVQKEWGGATIDAHTGKALASDANAFAVTVKPAGTESVSIHENPTPAEWSHAVDTAIQRFGPTLANQQHYLGVFHDNALGRIDLDPVVVVNTRAESDAIGAYTHAIGGAYNFADGNGYWAPHVVTTGKGVMAEIEKSEKPEWIKHFKGIGQWYSQAHAVSEHDHEKD